MIEQWKELKETIIELRDNDGTATQQEVCKFLANLIDVLEKQMQEPCDDTISRQAVLDIVDNYSESQSNVEDVTQDIISDIVVLPSVNPQPKTGHWIEHKNNGMTYIECSKCSSWFLRMYLTRNSYCPNCGAKMEVSE